MIVTEVSSTAAAPLWRLGDPGVDIIAGASLARPMVDLPSSVVENRVWLPASLRLGSDIEEKFL
jgi:hypothetical protein